MSIKAASLMSELDNKQEQPEEKVPLSASQKKWMIIRRLSYIVMMNAIIPIVLYYLLKPHFPPVWALVLSTTPTILSVLAQALFMKRVDSFGVAVLFGFTLSVVLAALNGDPTILLLRESFVTAGLGIVCILTLIPFRYKSFTLKPVLYYIARDLISLKPVYFLNNKPPQARMDFYWQNSPYCRLHFRIMTAIDVIILEIEFGLKLFYILQFDLDTVVILSNTTLSVIGIIVSLSTIGYILQIIKQLMKEEESMLTQAGAVQDQISL
ncbi:hypothetical protein BDB01DRAFT_854432 [Pilobolus umbonatus]|nr:hypothetical protein BDB01DRAFT_854432 [Pilobolus umbonatus]